MKRLLFCAILLASATFCDDFDDALAARDRGDYEEAFRLFEKLCLITRRITPKPKSTGKKRARDLGIFKFEYSNLKTLRARKPRPKKRESAITRGLVLGRR